MQIRILSDLHLEGKSTRPYEPSATDADVVVLAGDIHGSPAEAISWARARFDVPVVMVAGNHEFFGNGVISSIREGRALSGDGIHFLEDDVVVIDGVRFLGCTLWTDFALYGSEHVRESMSAARDGMPDFANILVDEPQNGFMALRWTPKASAARHAASRRFLDELMSDPFEGPTVVVTHHAPHPRSVPALFDGHPVTPAFASDLGETIVGGAPELWIHGHTHDAFDYRLGETRIVCNPRAFGTRDAGFREALVVDVEQRPAPIETLQAFVAGRIEWPEAAERFGVVDPWPIRNALLGVRPWSLIAERFAVPVEAIAAIHAFIRPRPQVWPEAVSAVFSDRMREALTVLDRLMEFPEEFRDDKLDRTFDR